jgi:hypothetical protein
MESNKDAAEKVIDDTNLLKFLVTGFSLNVLMSCKKNVKHQLMEFLQKMIGQIDKYMQFDNHLSKYYEKFLKIMNSFITLPKESMDKKCQKWNKENPDIPDAVDLIDEIGFMFEKYQDLLSNNLYVEEFLDDLKENGLCDIEMGVVDDGTKISMSLVTSGVVELYNEVMEGMAET